MADHDGSYKLLFSQRRMVEDLLRGFVHEPWVAGLDFASLEKVSSTFVSDELRHREDDVIWRVKWCGSEWVYVYLLFEFQSTVDRFMAVRILAYVALLYQDLIRQGGIGPRDRLPLVLPIVLYNGKPRWRAAREVARLIGRAPRGLAAYQPRLRYFLLDEGALPAISRSGLRNVAAALFRLERSAEPEEIRQVVASLVESLAGGQNRELRRAFVTWLTRVLLPSRWPQAEIPAVGDLGEMKAMLEETVLGWTKRWQAEGLRKGRQEGQRLGRQEGREEGRKEGRVEGEAALLLRQLEWKFGRLDEPTRQRVEAAGRRQRLTWAKRLLQASSLAEVFRS